jgi:hypothetical protein
MATVTASYNWVSGETVTPAKLNSAAAPTVVVADNEVTTAKILDATSTTTGVTNTKLRHSAALSVVGRSANSAGAPADIAAAADGEVFRRSGTAVGFGQVATAGIADDAVTNDKLSLSANAGEVKKAINADNDPPIFACRAWVNFDGTAGSTVDGEFRCTIRASGNVSKVVRTTNPGTFVVHFATAMPDNDYCVFAMPNEAVLGNRSSGINIRGTDDSAMGTANFTIDTGSSASGGAGNISVNCVSVFR